MPNVFFLFLNEFVFVRDRAFKLVIQLLKFLQTLSLFRIDLLEDFSEAVRFFIDLLCLRIFGRKALIRISMQSLVFSEIDHDVLWAGAFFVQALLLVELELIVEEIGSRLPFTSTIGARCLTSSIAVLAFAQAASGPRHIIFDAITVGRFIGFPSIGDLVVLGIYLVDLGLLGIHIKNLLLILFLLPC